MTLIGADVTQDELVIQRRRDFLWSFYHVDDDGVPSDLPDGDLFFELETGSAHNCVQQVTLSRANAGTYKLGLGGGWSPAIDYYDSTNALSGMGVDISDAIEAIPAVGVGNVEVRSVSLVPEWRIKLTLNEGVNEVQRISFVNDPTGGSYRLTYGIYMTGNIAYDAEASVVETAIEGLTGIGEGNVEVSGTAEDGYIVEFVGSLANTDVGQLGAIPRGIGFGLLGGVLGFGLFQHVQVETITRGTAKMGEKLVNTLNTAINDFFDQFENLFGVDIDFVVNDASNASFTATSKRSYGEDELITFAVDVTSNALKGFFNGVSYFLGVFDTISVDFRWNHTYEVEFVNELANQPVSALSVDAELLEGADDDQSVVVEVIEPGKAALTKWLFDVDGANASLKVESEEVDLILPRTKWQLAFLPDGELHGGIAISRGTVRVQS